MQIVLPEWSASAAASPARSEGSASPRAVVAPLLLEASTVISPEISPAAPATALSSSVVRVEARTIVRPALVASSPTPVSTTDEATEPNMSVLLTLC